MLLRALQSCIFTWYALRSYAVWFRRTCALKWVCAAGSMHFKVRIVVGIFGFVASVRRKGDDYAGSARFKEVF